ncbi:MAG: nitrogen regulation protein NR(I) [Nitrospinae bacterium CG11_big_fil_rev_8_21_14_0_20_56_8]|nr:MAG: nitrogen regulation protein NR(I) [Nitrospinae bacterium CG11_big_fil_rev_8_21_14_0_20_56_8]
MNAQHKILVVDDEENIRWVLKKALEKKPLIVHTAESGEEALRKIEENDYLMVFSDIFLEGISGLDLLQQVKNRRPETKVVVMTAQDTMNNTIEAMRLGAYDYISKPFDIEEIYALVEKVEATAQIPVPRAEPVPVAGPGFSVDAIIGKSRKMQEIFKTIGKAAGSDLPVLITGESGTGKEMVARALHFYSGRSNHPFICINCAAIARELLESELFGHERGAFTGATETKEGKFELAEGGTLFLDEIGDMELSLQAKILRVLQNQEFYRVGGKQALRADVRIIAATNQDLQILMDSKRFREDLFHRLNVIHIHLPPLRERKEDILLLANHFIHRFGKELSRAHVYLSPDVERILQNYHWRGNIRELENMLKRALVLASSGPILPEHLPPQVHKMELSDGELDQEWENRLRSLVREYLDLHFAPQEGHLYDQMVQALEKQLFQLVLDRFSGKQVGAAKALGINRNTLKRKIDTLSVQINKRKTSPDT